MDYSLAYLPLLCKQLLRGTVDTQQVRLWLPDARQDWLREANSQNHSHQEWTRYHLTRRDRSLVTEAVQLAQVQQRSLWVALEHLNRYTRTLQRPEVVRAAARWRRAELAGRQYLQHRGELERSALDWQTKKASLEGRPTQARREGEFFSREEICSISRPATHRCLITTAS